MRIVALDAFPADQGDLAAWGPVMALGDFVRHPRTLPADLVARCRETEAILSNKVPIPGDLIAGLPRLRYIGVTATGIDHIDLAACRARGIAVTNVPGYSTRAVAQLTIALMLELAQDVGGHGQRVRQGDWARALDFCFFTRPVIELAGRTLVLVGLGAIGSTVAGIARALGMEVIAAQVPGSPSSRQPLPEVLPRADIVSLHCPLTPATRGMVSASFLSLMPHHALLVNTARGGLIDRQALLAHLGAGNLGGVALDVLEREPPVDDPLLDPGAPWADRLVVTPHIGWGTVEARTRLIRATAANLADHLGGGRSNRVD